MVDHVLKHPYSHPSAALVAWCIRCPLGARVLLSLLPLSSSSHVMMLSAPCRLCLQAACCKEESREQPASQRGHGGASVVSAVSSQVRASQLVCIGQ